MKESDCLKEPENVERIMESISNLGPEEAIIVEGEKDRKSLRSIGVSSTIYVINNGKSVVENSEKLAKRYKKIIIMTDWDRKGGQLAHEFYEQLKLLGVDVSLEERKELSFLCKKYIKDIESLYEFMRTKSGRLG